MFFYLIKGILMTNETFEQQTQILNDHRKGVFKAKGDHYANNGDRLENITNIANLAGITRETACLTLAGKHIAALTDKAKKGEPVPMALRLELIGDIMNYFELLSATMFERELASNNFGSICTLPKKEIIRKAPDGYFQIFGKERAELIERLKTDAPISYERLIAGIIISVTPHRSPLYYIGANYSKSGEIEVWHAQDTTATKKITGKERKKLIKMFKAANPKTFNALVSGLIKHAEFKVYDTNEERIAKIEFWIDGDEIVVTKD